MDLSSLMPMLMMGSSDKGVFGLIIAALLTLVLKYFDLNDALESARAACTRKTMAFTMEARVTKDNENTMSRAFSAVAYRVHTALVTKPSDDPIWKHIHDVKEITLSARSIVANVFSRGYCVIDGVKITIYRVRETEQVESEERGTKVTEKVSTWTIRLESEKYDTIDRFVKSSTDSFDEYLKKMSSESRQTLFVATQVFKNGGAIKVIYSEEYFSSTKTFDNLMFPRKRDMLAKIDRFQNDEEWFARLGRPYKLNMMFSGAPGTSKTSCIKAIANYTGRHVVLLRADRFDSMSDMCDAITGFSTEQAIGYRNCMFVIEEMDCMEDEPVRRDKVVTTTFTPVPVSGDSTMDLLREIAEDRRGPKKKKQPSAKASLGTMLNTFDGFQEMHGCMIIVTTNHPEKFDPALTRPGRLDPFEFQLLGAPEINGYWNMYFGTDVPADLAAEMKGVERVMSTADLSQYLDMGAAEAESGLRAFVHALKNKACKA